jgi:GNAT superfamily N-acetyltransferase
MTTGSTVRPASADDAEGFTQAYEAAWDATLAPLIGRTLAELVPFADRVASFEASFSSLPPETGIWVAEREGVIVGVAARLGSELRSLYVVPDAWGTGVAQSLMSTALDAMRAEGAESAELWVAEANKRARRFYEREGWEATDDTKVSELGPTEVCYRCRL